jgi:hypothetical protein
LKKDNDLIQKIFSPYPIKNLKSQIKNFNGAEARGNLYQAACVCGHDYSRAGGGRRGELLSLGD